MGDLFGMPGVDPPFCLFPLEVHLYGEYLLLFCALHTWYILVVDVSHRLIHILITSESMLYTSSAILSARTVRPSRTGSYHGGVSSKNE